MVKLPPAYQSLYNELAELIRKKPKKGYIESVVTTGEPDPIDALEKASTAVATGNRQTAVEILEHAINDPGQTALLWYVDDTEAVLKDLLHKAQQLPELEPGEAAQTSSRAGLTFMFVILAAVTIVIAFTLTV